MTATRKDGLLNLHMYKNTIYYAMQHIHAGKFGHIQRGTWMHCIASIAAIPVAIITIVVMGTSPPGVLSVGTATAELYIGKCNHSIVLLAFIIYTPNHV